MGYSPQSHSVRQLPSQKGAKNGYASNSLTAAMTDCRLFFASPNSIWVLSSK